MHKPPHAYQGTRTQTASKVKNEIDNSCEGSFNLSAQYYEDEIPLVYYAPLNLKAAPHWVRELGATGEDLVDWMKPIGHWFTTTDQNNALDPFQPIIRELKVLLELELLRPKLLETLLLKKVYCLLI